MRHLIEKEYQDHVFPRVLEGELDVPAWEHKSVYGMEWTNMHMPGLLRSRWPLTSLMSGLFGLASHSLG